MAEAESTTEDISGFVVATAGLLNFQCWYDKSDSTLYLTKGDGQKIHRFHLDREGAKRMRDEDWINVLRAIKQGIDHETSAPV